MGVDANITPIASRSTQRLRIDAPLAEDGSAVTQRRVSRGAAGDSLTAWARSVGRAQVLHIRALMSATVLAPGGGHAILVLVRHGESVWNRSMRLTGWADVPLSGRGREQANQAGADLRGRGVVADVCYSSCLRRAIDTRDLLLAALGAAPALRESWRINERHYGALQGLRWWRAAWRFGFGVVYRCTREFDARPPLDKAPEVPAADAGIARSDANEWREAQRGESLADALRRFLPLWVAEIAPALRSGACVFIVAHNNLLRGLIGHLEGGRERPMGRLATARPYVFELDSELHVVRRVTL